MASYFVSYMICGNDDVYETILEISPPVNYETVLRAIKNSWTFSHPEINCIFGWSKIEEGNESDAII